MSHPGIPLIVKLSLQLSWTVDSRWTVYSWTLWLGDIGNRQWTTNQPKPALSNMSSATPICIDIKVLIMRHGFQICRCRCQYWCGRHASSSNKVSLVLVDFSDTWGASRARAICFSFFFGILNKSCLKKAARVERVLSKIPASAFSDLCMQAAGNVFGSSRRAT